jgi:hypothetical protein
MGFRENGVPLEITLNKLGLEFCIDDLEQAEGSRPLVNSWVEAEGNSANFGKHYRWRLISGG